MTFNRKELKKSLMDRKEIVEKDCSDCGVCCKDSGCVAYDPATKLCKIWKYADYQCKMFPLFKWQIEFRKEVKKVCKYSWNEKT